MVVRELGNREDKQGFKKLAQEYSHVTLVEVSRADRKFHGQHLNRMGLANKRNIQRGIRNACGKRKNPFIRHREPHEVIRCDDISCISDMFW